MKVEKNDVAILLSIVVIFFYTIAIYVFSKMNGGIGTAPIVFSGDDGLMYHRVAIGEDTLGFELFWVKIIKFLYDISIQDTLVVRMFLFSLFAFNLFYVVYYNKKNKVICCYPKKYGVKIVFLLFCFSPAIYLFYFFSIYRDAMIAICLFFSSMLFYSRNTFFGFVFLVVLFLLRPYMAGSVLLSFVVVSFLGVKKPFRLLFCLLFMFAMVANLVTPISNWLGFSLIDFRGGFSDSGANSTFGINFDGSVINNTLSYWFSFVLNFCSGLPLFYDRPVYIVFFLIQSLPVIIVFIWVFFNKVPHSILERKLLITFLVWIMTYSLMNDNAGNSLRLFSAGLPILLFVSSRLYLYSGLKLN